MTDSINLSKLPKLAELFKFFNAGKHLNRSAQASFWAELEANQNQYQSLFAALGYPLKIDGRGFAWFEHQDLSSNISNQSRQLALLFMVIFDRQADAGQSLSRFYDWRIDNALLQSASEQHQEILNAENLDIDGLKSLLEKAEGLGFCQKHSGYWTLLPAVCRYLDHFEALAQHSDTDTDTQAEVEE